MGSKIELIRESLLDLTLKAVEARSIDLAERCVIMLERIAHIERIDINTEQTKRHIK